LVLPNDLYYSIVNHEKLFKMTSLKSIMERRTMQVLDVQNMKNLKGGNTLIPVGQTGGGLPPPTGGNGDTEG
jgi:hypothetical protein